MNIRAIVDEWAKLTKEQQDYYADKLEQLENWQPPAEEALSQEQEPVAWYGIGDMYVWKRNLKEDKDATMEVANRNLANNENWKPLYTHPAPAWQGLSDDEIELIELYRKWKKEKNHG